MVARASGAYRFIYRSASRGAEAPSAAPRGSDVVDPQPLSRGWRAVALSWASSPSVSS